MAEFRDEDLEEALRQKYQGRSLDLTPSGYDPLLGLDLTKVDVPTYPADLIHGGLRAFESITDAPLRAGEYAAYQGGNPLEAALSQLGAPPESAPTREMIDEAALLRHQARFGPKLAEAMLKPSDVAGLIGQFDVPGPGLAMGMTDDVLKRMKALGLRVEQGGVKGVAKDLGEMPVLQKPAPEVPLGEPPNPEESERLWRL